MSTENFNSEKALIKALQHKKQVAYNHLYVNYAAALYGVIIRIVGSEGELANDLLQETFVKIWQYIDQYDADKGRLYTWMLNIARNTAIDKARSAGYRNRKKHIEIQENAFQKDGGRLSENFSVDHIGLEKLTEQLEEKYRVLIDLTYFEEYTQKEVAEELDIPLGTVKTRLRKALLLLKEIVR